MVDPHVKVPDINPRKSYAVGSTPQSAFTINWTFYTEDDIRVFVNGVELTGSAFSVAGNPGTRGGFEGGQVTLAAAVANVTVMVMLDLVVQRTADFPESAGLSLFALNNDQDYSVSLIQKLDYSFRNRTLSLPDTEDDFTATLPTKAGRTGKYLWFDVNGQPAPADLVIGFPGPGTITSSVAALKALSVAGMTTGAQVLTLSYYGTGGASSQFGGGVFRYNSASAVAEDGGTIFQPNIGSGRWERVYDGELYNTWFGTVGDGVADDTAAWQRFLDALLATGRAGRGMKGNYSVGPLYGNGTAWVLAGKPVISGVELAGVRALYGQGRLGFGCRLIARAGLYGPTDAVFTQLQCVSVTIEGLAIDQNNVASKGIDTHWTGPNTANGNTFRDWFVENGTAGGGPCIDVSGAADGEIGNITYRGGSPLIALRMQLGGGGIWCHDIYIYRGRVELSCQNAGIVNFFFGNGLKVTQTSINAINLHAGQISQDPDSGFSIYTDNNPGDPIITSMTCTSMLFLKGASFQAHFAGRWYTGANCNGCDFVDDGYVSASATTSIAAALANWNFDYCSVAGAGAQPADIPGVCTMSKWQFRTSAATISSERTYSTRLRLGDAPIDPSILNATLAGVYGRNQVQGVFPSDAQFGMSWNRTANSDVDIVQGGDILRMVKWAAGVATTQYTFNNTATSAFHPGTDGTRKLGMAGNKWSEVFAANGTINTSGADMKTAVEPLSPAEIAAAKALAREIGTFQFLASVAKKGDAARHHVGMTVQRAMEIMTEHGLEPFRYGFICYDRWDREELVTPEVKDEDGVVIRPESREVREAGESYGFRPDQLALFIARGIEARLAALEAGNA